MTRKQGFYAAGLDQRPRGRRGGWDGDFVITFDRPSAGVVSLIYTTQDGTALAGSDYVAASGTLNFAPGETAKTVKVQLINDALPRKVKRRSSRSCPTLSARPRSILSGRR